MSFTPATVSAPVPARVCAGLDWASVDHAVCILDVDGSVLERFFVVHDAAGLKTLVRRLLNAGVDEVGIERGDGPVVDAFDTDLVHASIEQATHEGLQTGGIVDDEEPLQNRSVDIENAHGVVDAGPVKTGTDSRWNWRGDGSRGETHGCYLAVRAVREHPVVPGPRSRSLTDRRSSAHSPVAGLGVLGHRTSQNSCWTSKVERPWRWSGGDQGWTGSPSGTTDTRMVHQ